ncbi:MAG: type II secretion system minor pseudopilin GspI [Pseudomonadota bacterium]|nr:type II secretion system minor pseudopilin GspI [Pseudomonadota bacterium]
MHRSGIAAPLRDGLARTSRGFTLIEVLVALVIVAVTLGAGVKAAGALLNNTQRLTEISEAQWCADNELTGLRLGKIYPNVGDSTFNCQQLGRNYVGTLQVRATPNPNFRRIDATMANEAGESMLTISTILPRY